MANSTGWLFPAPVPIARKTCCSCQRQHQSSPLPTMKSAGCTAGTGKDAPGEAAGRASGRTGEREPKLAERSRAGTTVPGAASEGGRAPS